MSADRRQEVLSKQQLMQAATGSVLFGLVATLLSGFARSEPTRIIEIASGYYIEGSWLGWPVQYVYHTDIVRPESSVSEQAVDGYLLGLSWLSWTLIFLSLTLLVTVARALYASSRR